MNRLIFAVPLTLSVLLFSTPGFALTPAEVHASLQASKQISPQAALDIWVVGNQVTLVTSADMSAGDAYLGKEAGALAQTVFTSSGSGAKQVTVIFTDKSGSKSYRAFSLDAAQAAEIHKTGAFDPRMVAVTIGERVSSAGASFGAVKVESAGLSVFQAKKAALMVRINMLKGKGVGVKPYLDQITQIDERMRTSGPEHAAIALGALEKVVLDQEKASNAAATGAAPGAASPKPVATSIVDNLNKSFQGNNDDYEESIRAAFMKQELGDLYVHKGPFSVERLRVARQIHQLDLQGRDMSGYKNMFNQIESGIKDPRRMRDTVQNLQYLQSQLGVKQLK